MEKYLIWFYISYLDLYWLFYICNKIYSPITRQILTVLYTLTLIVLIHVNSETETLRNPVQISRARTEVQSLNWQVILEKGNATKWQTWKVERGKWKEESGKWKV